MKWEYLIIRFARNSNGAIQDDFVLLTSDSKIKRTWNKDKLLLLDALAKYGQEGWEAVGITDNSILFKRPIP